MQQWLWAGANAIFLRSAAQPPSRPTSHRWSEQDKTTDNTFTSSKDPNHKITNAKITFTQSHQLQANITQGSSHRADHNNTRQPTIHLQAEKLKITNTKMTFKQSHQFPPTPHLCRFWYSDIIEPIQSKFLSCNISCNHHSKFLDARMVVRLASSYLKWPAA